MPTSYCTDDAPIPQYKPPYALYTQEQHEALHKKIRELERNNIFWMLLSAMLCLLFSASIVAVFN